MLTLLPNSVVVMLIILAPFVAFFFLYMICNNSFEIKVLLGYHEVQNLNGNIDRRKFNTTL